MPQLSRDDDLQKQLIRIFVDEANEYIEAINQKLLVLEKEPKSESANSAIGELLREAHSLKGAARAVNILEIETLSHHLENIFVGVRDHYLALSAEDFDLLFKAVDSISLLVKKASGAAGKAPDTGMFIDQLDKLAASYIHKGSAKKASRIDEHWIAEKHLNSDFDPVINEKQQPIDAGKGIFHQTLKKDETIRLSTNRLDILLSSMSELHAARIETKQHITDLAGLCDTLSQWEKQWHRFNSEFQKEAVLNRSFSHNNPAESTAQSGITNWFAPDGIYTKIAQLNNANFKNSNNQINTIIHALKTNERKIDQLTTEMEEEIRRTRMLPIATIFNAFPRAVRDLARECGKEIVLNIEGEDTEVDRAVLEQIKDPLLHLVRNSVDHGIESPSVRLEKGKSAKGLIQIKAMQQGSNLILEVSDDGMGINLETIKEIAIQKKFITKKSADDLSDREILWLIFRTGFSSAKTITDLSGRGVGLDIVRKNIEVLNGIIRIENDPGKGVKFILSVPLTVATTNCLLVHTGMRKFRNNYTPIPFAIPITNISRMIRISTDQISSVEGRLGIVVDNEPLELRYLADILGLPRMKKGFKDSAKTNEQVLIIEAAEKTMAIVVDVILNTQETVIKKLPWPFNRVDKIAGDCILSNGEPAFILNMAEVVAGAQNQSIEVFPEEEAVQSANARKNFKVLVVDDSITTRTLEKNIIEEAGYQVLSASDGIEAWSCLKSEAIDLVVSDIVMPRLDGVGLCKKIRESEQFKHLPVILVTSMDSERDRKNGMEAGADAYLVKKVFDQTILLEAIERLI